MKLFCDSEAFTLDSLDNDLETDGYCDSDLLVTSCSVESILVR